MAHKRYYQVLLTEYVQAQSSAQYHDTLLWTTTGIMMGGVGVLLSIAFSGDGESASPLFLVLYCDLAAMITIINMLLTNEFRKYKIEKYKRCKEIEELLGQWQHKMLPPRPRQGVYVVAALWMPILFVALVLRYPAYLSLSGGEMAKVWGLWAVFFGVLIIKLADAFLVRWAEKEIDLQAIHPTLLRFAYSNNVIFRGSVRFLAHKQQKLNKSQWTRGVIRGPLLFVSMLQHLMKSLRMR